MKQRAPGSIYELFFLYVAISLAYQLAGAVSLVIGYFDLRHQVHDFAFSVDDLTTAVTNVEDEAVPTGMATGDSLESLNGIPFTGRAMLLSTRFYSHPGDVVRVGFRKPDGRRITAEIPLRGYTDPLNIGESVFIMALHIVVPLACVLLGCWVVWLRPMNPHAWLILILLSFPQAYIPSPLSTGGPRCWRFACIGTSFW